MTFFPGKPEGADGEDMETESHVDTQVSHWALSLSVFVRLFCLLVFFFFGGNKQVAHLAWHTSQPMDELSLVVISCRPTCDAAASCNWKCSAICSSRSPALLRLIADVLKLLRIASQMVTIFNHFTCNYGSNRLTGVCCIRRCCSQLTIAGLPAKLNSAQLCRQAGGQCLQQIMIPR